MHVPACTAAAAAVRRGSAAPPPPAAGREVRGACARELAALELLEQEVEPRLVLERDVKAHDRWVAQRAEQLLLTVQVGQLRLALDVALLDGFERLGGRRAPVPHAQHAARHAAAEHTAELQVGQRRERGIARRRVHHFGATIGTKRARWRCPRRDAFQLTHVVTSPHSCSAPTERVARVAGGHVEEKARGAWR